MVLLSRSEPLALAEMWSLPIAACGEPPSSWFSPLLVVFPISLFSCWVRKKMTDADFLLHGKTLIQHL